ncbi:Gfo/Idh/MocA family protein [Mangrovicoccus algicola]|uniref:Gfo/Idh/MocA family oxidoreductase n=1 Tax=Mangrovicoccus algicola TaxID=2771008 RepID=A0A8J7CZA6_9RHOB|nr:Gfo/Idh/MocA family oxidoreductase [Mangrovicoccus algicola]MBE3637588.1 Gfo/Idh/MocA family oxidoreductase [Mangrovicoccus algicola]
MSGTLKFAALGLDHGHILGMAEGMAAAGAEFAGYWGTGSPPPLEKLRARFPDVPQCEDMAQILGDPSIGLVLIAAIPDERAALAIAAMEAGKDVMVDKPGCTSAAQLAALRDCVARTGRIWSVNFSERFRVPSATRAGELIRAGAIGEVVNTVGLGPHRLEAPRRAPWFFERARYGGILTDIASHQIDQFLHFTGAETAEISMATVANRAHPEYPGLQDFGELALRSPRATGYVRVDWFTPGALPVWGDGRVTILGTEGYIELRKYLDPGHGPQTDTLILVNGTRMERIDCRDAGLPYFAALAADIRDRTQTAMAQSHAFEVMRLALEAQALAEGGTVWAQPD